MKLTFLMLLSLTAIGAYAQDVRNNFDRTADFTKYRTYKWVRVKDAGQLPELAERQFKDAVAAELAKKGLTNVEGDADLVVDYQAAVNQEKEFSSYTSGFGPGWGYGYGWGGGWGGSSITTGQTTTIHVGSIGFDMYDSAKQQLVWRGMVSKTLDAKAKPEKAQKNLNKAVAKLFKNYPPRAKK